MACTTDCLALFLICIFFFRHFFIFLFFSFFLFNFFFSLSSFIIFFFRWIRDVLEPIRNKYFPNVKIYLKTNPHSDNAIAARLIGQFPDRNLQQHLQQQQLQEEESRKKKLTSQKSKTSFGSFSNVIKNKKSKTSTTRMREIVVLKHPPCVQIFDVVEHGRRFYRTLSYTSDVHHCLSSHEGVYNPLTQTCETKNGLNALPDCNIPSLVITRNLSTEIGKQTFIPSRFLDGLLPECLRTQYDFWQSDSNTIQGYERNPSATSSHTTALIILLSTHGKGDATGNGNGRAHGVVTRIPVHSNEDDDDDDDDDSNSNSNSGGKERRKSLSITDVVSEVVNKIRHHKKKTGEKKQNKTSSAQSQKGWKRAKKALRRQKRKSVALSSDMLNEVRTLSKSFDNNEINEINDDGEGNGSGGGGGGSGGGHQSLQTMASVTEEEEEEEEGDGGEYSSDAGAM